METEKRKKINSSLALSSQGFFIILGLFLLYIKQYVAASSALIFFAGLPYQKFKGNRIILFLSWIALGIGGVAAGVYIYQQIIN